MRLIRKTAPAFLALTCMTVTAHHMQAASFTVQTFATGAAVGGTSPDSVEFGDGSLWVSYQNGADSTGTSGASTVVRYDPSGSVPKTWSIAGNVDGLRIDPATGLVWALQNNDGNSALTVINPLTNATTAYAYGSSYKNSANRGFDDAVFRGGQVFLSETNPAAGTDPTVLRLTNTLASAPLQVAGILNSTLTGTNLATGKTASTTITDSDSLIQTPTGDLALTGEADKQIVFIHNPGTAGQTASFISLLAPGGSPVSGSPDDTVYPTAANGFIYLADTGANAVYKLTASGLTPGSVYVDVGTEFGSLDLSTGVVTPIFTGVSPHGAQFVATPEPASIAYALGGLMFCAIVALVRRRSSNVA
jgi:hypothetical protein